MFFISKQQFFVRYIYVSLNLMAFTWFLKIFPHLLPRLEGK